jgi:hypothetical protein
MSTRQAHARREGDLKEGRGRVDFGGGAFNAPYSADTPITLEATLRSQ